MELKESSTTINQSQKRGKAKKEKPKKKKSKKVVIVPKILNTEDYVKYYSNIAMDEMVQFSFQQV